MTDQHYFIKLPLNSENKEFCIKMLELVYHVTFRLDGNNATFESRQIQDTSGIKTVLIPHKDNGYVFGRIVPIEGYHIDELVCKLLKCSDNTPLMCQLDASVGIDEINELITDYPPDEYEIYSRDYINWGKIVESLDGSYLTIEPSESWLSMDPRRIVFNGNTIEIDALGTIFTKNQSDEIMEIYSMLI